MGAPCVARKQPVRGAANSPLVVIHVGGTPELEGDGGDEGDSGGGEGDRGGGDGKGGDGEDGEYEGGSSEGGVR